MSRTDIFTDPDRFFSRKTTEGGFKGALAVVLAAAISNALSNFATMLQLQTQAPQGAGGVIIVGQLVGSVVAVLGILVTWVVFAGLFHLISIYFDGDGQFREVVRLTGYGFVPFIFMGVISGVINFFVYQGVSLPRSPEGITTFVQQTQSGPLFVLLSVISIVFVVWRGFLWMFAVKYARGLTIRQAAITVGIPVGISILASVVGLVT